MTKKLTIAIDGHSSTGKSTMARQLAELLNYNYVDTGAMYRAVALYALRNGAFDKGVPDKDKLVNLLGDISLTFTRNEESGKSEISLNGEIVEPLIRGVEISSRVSKVAAITKVREKLVAEQQKMGKDGGVVMDGRDIGTVVFPDAELKIFMTANEDVRAERRYKELTQKGEEVTLQAIKQNLQERDYMDTQRADSPLKVADDAKELDNSNLSMQEQFDIALGWVNEIQKRDN